MAILEAFEFGVEILDEERLRRGVGANALAGGLELFDRRANVELDEDWEAPLVRIGSHVFPGRVGLVLLGSTSLAVVQTWDMPRPAKYRDIPDAADLPPTMADDITGVRAYILAHAQGSSARNRVVAELWDRNLTNHQSDETDALPFLLPQD